MTQAVDEQVYAHLRALAGRIHRARGGGSETLQPTALVHEAWMKVHRSTSEIVDRGHFLAVAAKAMRQILVDRARARSRLKRGENPVQTTLTGVSAQPFDAESYLAFDAVLDELRAVDPVAADVVMLRAFAGATVPEAAASLGVSPSKIDRSWRFARAFIADRVQVD